MIIKGKSRSDPIGLAAHLNNAETNERVELLETRGTVAQDLRGALIEMDAYGLGTRCERPLYHANVDWPAERSLSAEQKMEAVDALEERLGLTGHQRAVVLHEKHGREHLHVVWTRIDLDRMVSVSDSHNYRKHEEVARDLERRFGHERVQGAHHEREGVERPERTPSRAELRQEQRTGILGKDVRADVTEAFRASDGPEAFRSALDQADYMLAKGDRRDFVVVDREGGIHSLARRIEGMHAKELREFMAPLDRESLPDIKFAREIMEERKERREAAHNAALLEKAHARGDDYVSQTQAALKENERNQERLKEIRPERPAEPEVVKANEDKERIDKILDQVHERQSREADIDPSERQSSEVRAAANEVGDRLGNREMTEDTEARINRQLERDRNRERTEEDEFLEPDRQREAPGGGRTRSR